MAKRKLSRLDIRANVVSFLSTKKIHTVEEVLSMHLIEFLELGITLSDATTLIDVCSKAACPAPIKASAMLRSERFCPTSLSGLDACLAGGLICGTVTEIAGPSGCGKTQFCMMMAAVVAATTRGAGVIFLDTEGAFSAERLVEIIEVRFPAVFADETSLVQTTEAIKHRFFNTSAELLRTLERLDETISKINAKLIVLDSAASLLRKEYPSATAQRQEVMSSQASLLKRWSELFQIPVLVTNQVTTRFDDHQGGDAYVTAALGNTWAHSVNTRITVNYSEETKLRYMNVIKSPLVPSSSVAYTVSSEGITEVSNSDDAAVAREESHKQAATTVKIQARASGTGSGIQHAAILQAQRSRFLG